MHLVLALLQNTVCVVLSVLQLAMLVRAIMSWFPTESNRFENFLYVITEPLIMPIRWLFEKLNWFQGIPIDMSFMVAYLVLSVVVWFLA